MPADGGPHASSCSESKFAQALGSTFIVESCLSIPVSSEAGTLGALVFGSAGPKAFTERSERIVASIAAQAVIGIEKARLFEEGAEFQRREGPFPGDAQPRTAHAAQPRAGRRFQTGERPPAAAGVQQDLNVVLRNVRLEARLIDDLLDFSRIINGKLQLQREPLDLHALIRSVVDICADDIAAARTSSRWHSTRRSAVGLRGFCPAPTGALERVEERGQVHSRPGPNLDWHPLADDRTVEVNVADNGVGIEPAALARIFSAFEQGRCGHHRKFGGLGLGLAISKAFVELHDGKVYGQQRRGRARHADHDAAAVVRTGKGRSPHDGRGFPGFRDGGNHGHPAPGR